MKEEIKTIKEEVAILSHNQACIDAVIIKSAQDLLEKKIYPNYDEFKESAEFFLRESDNEFFFTLGSKWKPYFEKKFENLNMLPPISNVVKASEIVAWKKKLAVSNCFRKLFEKIEDDENDTYMTKIIKNVWSKKKNIPNLQIAWAISISEIFLNPKNEVIKMSEEIIQPALARNLVKGFKYELDSSPTPQRSVSPERQKDPEKQIEPERNKGKKRSIEVETLRKNLKKSKRKVENNEYEGNEGEEGEEGDEGEDDDDEDDEDEEGEDEEYHNEIVNIESED
ncbi:hypothetical protein Glove_148g36 [Diversispora epigaea]|uniref:Uncharacterized protein n=1 Tax=Diversispora epigaea TaxID=1348612 RepID=A0A397J022_9GLOM|nr:hypothetical protein Glove_148g36 [Diversispora epigaea]